MTTKHTGDEGSHYYGDDCVPPHMSPPDSPAKISIGQWRTERKARIREHVEAARKFRDRAHYWEAKCNKQRDTVVRDRVTDAQRTRAKAGNEMAKKILADRSRLERAIDTAAGEDPFWKAYAANNRWMIDYATMESNMARMEMEYLNLEGTR